MGGGCCFYGCCCGCRRGCRLCCELKLKRRRRRRRSVIIVVVHIAAIYCCYYGTDIPFGDDGGGRGFVCHGAACSLNTILLTPFIPSIGTYLLQYLPSELEVDSTYNKSRNRLVNLAGRKNVNRNGLLDLAGRNCK